MSRSYAAARPGLITSEVIAAHPADREDGCMNAHRILQLNAVTTAISAAAMIVARPTLYPLFGLSSPLWLDVATIVFVAYAAALLFVVRRPVVRRLELFAFSIGDGLCFAAGLVVLIAFWSNLTPIARVLIAVTTIVVDVFALAQYRAARIAQ
jgi:hypothetical protein